MLNLVNSKMKQETESAYLAYSYSYPHKTAYREFEQPLSLFDLWAKESRQSLFLYMHIPFCEMRCGFCNLFTTTGAAEEFTVQYLRALERQAHCVSGALQPFAFSRMAIGGGTPTYLTPGELDHLFDIAERCFNVSPASVPTSVESSPLTADSERLSVLRSRGVSRLSIGVQSFLEEEVRSIGRPQKTEDVVRALQNVRNAEIANLNIDLIYGIPGQTRQSWMESLTRALEFNPEEVYLYPLYIRPQTGLGRTAASLRDSNRLDLYRFGRDFLLERGYKQISMRMFQAPHAPAGDGPAYCCQKDGMVGIGCGARSYTTNVHYSSKYAVSAKPIRELIEDYITTPTEAFGQAAYGFELDQEERKRRFVIQSLLQMQGLSRIDYGGAFDGCEPEADFPVLAFFVEKGLAHLDNATIKLTAEGLSRSDQLGVELYSRRVKSLMQEFVIR